MKMNFSRENILQGLANKQKGEERPSTFATEAGATKVTEGERLDTSATRMAGQEGLRAMALMNSPDEQMRTDSWMAKFGMSNQGFEFNQAKMNQGVMAPPIGMAPPAE